MIKFPQNRKEVVDRSKTDVQSSLPQSNPFLRNSYLGAIVTAFSGRVFDFYLQLRELVRQMFPDTATGQFLVRWGEYVDIIRNPATKAEGPVVFTGTAGSAIPQGATVKSKDGREYNTQSSITLANNTLSVSSITRSGSTVTVTTTSEHDYATGLEVTISGANETEYNGVHEITVTSATEFTYEINSTPASPATGTIETTAVTADTVVKSVEAGIDQNLNSGAEVSLSSPLSGVDSTAFVGFGEIAGGTETESDEDLRDRVIERYANPISLFNNAAIRSEAKKVAGVTRVWIDQSGAELKQVTLTSLTQSNGVAIADAGTVKHGLQDGMNVRVEGADESGYNVDVARVIVIDEFKFAYHVDPAVPSSATGTITATSVLPPGQVRIFFTRDNDDSPIPSASEVQTVKDQIMGISPGHTSVEDVHVLAPGAVTVDFEITNLVPNTQSMKNSIEANLEVLFEERTTVGKDLKAIEYEAKIANTIDTQTGEKVQDFTINTPSGLISVDDGELAVLGDVDFV